MGVTVDPGGELTEKIDIFVPVEIPQPRSLAARDRQRKRVSKDRRAGVSARHRGAGFLMLVEALRVACPVELFGLGERGLDVDIDRMGCRHLSSCGAAPLLCIIARRSADKSGEEH